MKFKVFWVSFLAFFIVGVLTISSLFIVLRGEGLSLETPLEDAECIYDKSGEKNCQKDQKYFHVTKRSYFSFWYDKTNPDLLFFSSRSWISWYPAFKKYFLKEDFFESLKEISDGKKMKDTWEKLCTKDKNLPKEFWFTINSNIIKEILVSETT